MILVLVAGLPILTAAVAVLMRALRRRDDRAAWLALGAALLAETIGAIWVAWPGGETRFPSHADLVLLTFFPLVFVAALLFARRRLVRITPALWLDAAIGSVGAAAIVAQLLGETAQRATGGGWQSVVALLYPMFDVLLAAATLVLVGLKWSAMSKPPARSVMTLGVTSVRHPASATFRGSSAGRSAATAISTGESKPSSGTHSGRRSPAKPAHA